MQISVAEGLSEVSAPAWNRLAGDRNPFLRHEFLLALERNGCLQPWGWKPLHLLVHRDGELVGATPLYLKDNSYGELVFDHAWAEAYQRHGLAYYPKLVSAIPYTPVTGARLMQAEGEHDPAVSRALIKGATDLAERLKLSSVHWLFPNADDQVALEEAGLLQRSDTQFHWHNRVESGGYRDFDDFLQQLSSAKRKKVRRERRRVKEAGVSIEVRNGNDMSPDLWAELHALYSSTFDRKSGWPTLSLGFFEDIGRNMPEQVIIMLARQEQRIVAGTFNMRGSDAFFGRHWGCHEDIDSLHFEACYYQPIDYCIKHKLRRCEAGAQGEHKLSRGFLPVITHSAHWIAHPEFRRVIGDYLQREQRALGDYRDILHEHSPFRQATDTSKPPQEPAP